MNRDEERFWQRLGNVPDVPESVYPSITGRIRGTRTVRRGIWALAATLVIAAGVTFYTGSSLLPTPSPIAEQTGELSREVLDELQSIRDFLTGADLDREIETYASMDNGLY